MQIKCKVESKNGEICGKILSSKKEKPEDAFKELITSLEVHLKGRHNSQLEEYKEDLKDIQSACNALPAWMLVNAFIDTDSAETSAEFRKGYEELDDLLEPIAELFDINSEDDEPEIEKEAIAEEIEEVEPEVLIGENDM